MPTVLSPPVSWQRVRARARARARAHVWPLGQMLLSVEGNERKALGAGLMEIETLLWLPSRVAYEAGY